ncbi:hypothetical protein LPJ53_001139 [Coemansia erecta]|uniref:Uncharacterized protein n=1 Tax=Coemansia erecta TaxID=147472 RepID=A0A9W8CUW1_9FUNG|nr:hypothetical protein LPJ53_001139 [Coemansia erecta]
MFTCKCCGYECDCMDLYYDHIMFDSRHHEMAAREAEAVAAAAQGNNAKRMSSRGSLGSMRKRSSLLSRTSSAQMPSSRVPSKATFFLGAEAF